ncbi:MAG: DUF2284 domain-containing protein [Candidatus Hodarchaeota archaeon]
MTSREALEQLFLKNGFNDFKWIDPKEIKVAFWVRMKCIYGCPEYGKNASCPPNIPSVSECERFFQEYKKAVIFHFDKKVEKPEERLAWSKKINQNLLNLEREVFFAGYEKTFLLFMASCEICQECTKEREKCKHPRLSRPTPEAMAIDVFTTAKQVGYSIKVLKEYSEKMDRFAFLMIE